MRWYLGYAILFIDDFDRTVGFYVDQVGFPVRHRAEGYVEFAVEGSKFALLARSRVAELVGEAHAGLPARGAHEGEVAFLVEDVDRVYRELAARRVPFICAPQDRPWGQRTAYFHDPEGHLVEIATNLPRPDRRAAA